MLAVRRRASGVAMLKAILMFTLGVFGVWYFPAGGTAMLGVVAWAPALLAGLLVALPVSVIAGLGASCGALLARPTATVVWWHALSFGVACGLVGQFVSKPIAWISSDHVINQSLSSVPALLRIALVGLAGGFLMFVILGSMKGA